MDHKNFKFVTQLNLDTYNDVKECRDLLTITDISL